MYKFKTALTMVLTLAIMLSVAGGKGEVKPTSQPKTMPLVPMMQLLLDDMQSMDTGIYTANFEMIKNSSAQIANHPVMTEEDKRLVKRTLGEDIKKFVAIDRLVHHHADSIRRAAIAGDMKEILRHYSIVQTGCVNCHSSFRTQITQARQ